MFVGFSNLATAPCTGTIPIKFRIFFCEPFKVSSYKFGKRPYFSLFFVQPSLPYKRNWWSNKWRKRQWSLIYDLRQQQSLREMAWKLKWKRLDCCLLQPESQIVVAVYRLLTFTFRVTKGTKLGSVFAQLNLKLTTSAKWQNLHFGFELAQIWNRFHVLATIWNRFPGD